MQTIQFSKIMKATDYETTDAVDYKQICKYGSGYEKIPDDIPVKLYLDIDVALPVADINDVEDDMNETIRIVKTDITTVLKHILGEHYIEDQIFWGSSHGVLTEKEKIKVSYHIIINNIIAYKWAQKIIVQELNRTVFTILDDVEYYPHGMFDENPYHDKNQIIRSPYTAKPNKTFDGERPIKIESGTFEMSCISAFIPENTMIWEREKPVRATTSPEAAEGGPSAEGITVGCPINRQILEGIMPFLKRYAGPKQYKHWTTVLWGIKNITDDKDLGRIFSRLDMTAFDETSFDNIWDNAEIRDKGINIGTLISLAMKTDKEGTKQVLRKVENGVQKDSIREQGLQQLQTAVANASRDEEISMEYLFKNSPLKNGILDKYVAEHFHMVFKNKVVTVYEDTYVYNGIYWELSDKTHSSLQLLMSGQFINKLNMYWNYAIQKYSDEMASTDEEDTRKAIQLKIDLASAHRTGLAKKLLTQFGRKDYLKEVILYSKNNAIEFDQKSNLFVFKNCIFDLITQRKIEPNPLDYMSICCGYDYDDNYDKALENELLGVIKSIHQNEQIFEYFMTVMSTALTSEHLQYFIILTGAGGNGKGLLMKLYNTMLGEYAYTLPSQVLLQDIKLGPNPEVANMNGTRLCSTSEPKKGERIRCSTMKSLTGERTIGARKLQSNNCKTIMNNTMVMEVNEFAGFDETGDAITRRVRSIPFLSSAVSKAEYEQAEDKTNLTIKNTSYDTEEWRVKYRQALFNISLPFVDKFYKLGKDLPEMPKACIDKTNAHLALSDDLHLWIKELYIQDEDNYEIIPLKGLYDIITKNDSFRELPKEVKRRYKYGYFCDKMQENRTMRNFIVEKDKRYKNKGEKINAVSLCGWRKRTADDE